MEGRIMKKMNLNVVGALALFIFLLVTSLPSYAFELGARGYYWWPDFSAKVRVDKNSIIGTTVDAEDDLGMDDESYPSIEAFFGLGNHHLSLMYTKADYSGAKNISRPIVFNGQTYTADAYVESDLEFQMLDFEYQYDLLDLENILAGFSLGVIAKIKYIEGEARLKSTSPTYYDESETFKVPVPMLGLGLHLGILADILEARVKAAGIAYSGNTFYDAQADISLTPFPFVDIHAGYRIMKLDVDDISDVYADIEFKGPYAGLTISF
jgi:outer membrane protein